MSLACSCWVRLPPRGDDVLLSLEKKRRGANTTLLSLVRGNECRTKVRTLTPCQLCGVGAQHLRRRQAIDETLWNRMTSCRRTPSRRGRMGYMRASLRYNEILRLEMRSHMKPPPPPSPSSRPVWAGGVSTTRLVKHFPREPWWPAMRRDYSIVG